MFARKFLLLFILLLCQFAVHADTKQYMVLHLATGENIYILQSDIPKVSFVDGQIQINTQYYNLSGVSSYTIEQFDPSAIETVSSDEVGGIFVKDGYIVIPKTVAAENVHIYSVKGIELPLSGLLLQDGNYKINLQNCHDDIVLVKVGKTTLKFRTR